MLLDDHLMFREPLAYLLDREPDLTVVGQAGSLAEAAEVLENESVRIDVAVVDLDLPDGSGAAFVGDLREARPEAMTLVLSALSDRLRLAEAMEAGAAGIMHKSTRPREVLDSIRRLYAGSPLLSEQEVIEAMRLINLERRDSREARARLDSLTPREREVLQALAQGSSDKEITENLFLSEGTVRAHVTSILRKLEVHSRLQAVVFAVRHGAATIG